MEYNIKIYRINTSADDLRRFAENLQTIEGIEILLDHKYIRSTINSGGRFGFCAIMCKINVPSVDDMKTLCRHILSCIPGEVKIRASFVSKKSTNVTIPSTIHSWFFCKTNSLWGITVAKTAATDEVNVKIEEYLKSSLKSTFYPLVHDMEYNNYIVLASEFELDGIYHYNSFTVVPFLAGDITKIHFPQYMDKAQYKVVSVPKPNIDISGDDSSLDIRFW